MNLNRKHLRIAAIVAATAVVVGAIISGPSAGAAPFSAATGAHSRTPNPTRGSAGQLHAAVYAWSNGLTIDFTGGQPGTDEQLIYYGSGRSTQKVLNVILCNGPDYSVFIVLPPGEWTGSVSLITVFAQSFPAFTFDLEVGASGSKAAPATSCQSPIPFSGGVDYPVVGGAATPDGKGYWIVGSDGSVQGFGDAVWYGDMSGQQLNAPIVGLVPTADGNGYWLVAQDGGVFGFGDAPFYGSAGNIQLNQPVVGMAATPDGGGYWLVASDGGIFSYGNASFYGSTGGDHLNQPVVGMATTSGGHGYYLDASDGGIFAFGDARFQGSMEEPPSTNRSSVWPPIQLPEATGRLLPTEASFRSMLRSSEAPATSSSPSRSWE